MVCHSLVATLQHQYSVGRDDLARGLELKLFCAVLHHICYNTVTLLASARPWWLPAQRAAQEALTLLTGGPHITH
jgi:hypothetical protein